DFEEFPEFGRLEIVAVRDAEPERELVRPEGAVWGINHVETTKVESLWSYSLILAGCPIAEVKTSSYPTVSSEWHWRISRTTGGIAMSLELAKRAAEEAKATAGEDGFHWEEVELHTERWQCNVCGLPCRVEIEADDSGSVKGDRFNNRFSSYSCPCGEDSPEWHKIEAEGHEAEGKNNDTA
ncbi:hypothetical protein LCGC14_2106510, partial [marine sediment metagenome]